MHRIISLAIVGAAMILGLAILYHAREMRGLADRLNKLERRAGELDSRMNELSGDLPLIIQRAGREAGKEAVHGMVEEAVGKPLNWLNSKLAAGMSNVAGRVVSVGGADEPPAGSPWPVVRFDIPDPVIRVEILPNLKRIPGLPPIPGEGWSTPAASPTNSPAPGGARREERPRRKAGAGGGRPKSAA